MTFFLRRKEKQRKYNLAGIGGEGRLFQCYG